MWPLASLLSVVQTYGRWPASLFSSCSLGCGHWPTPSSPCCTVGCGRWPVSPPPYHPLLGRGRWPASLFCSCTSGCGRWPAFPSRCTVGCGHWPASYPHVALSWVAAAGQLSPCHCSFCGHCWPLCPLVKGTADSFVCPPSLSWQGGGGGGGVGGVLGRPDQEVGSGARPLL